jgi:hypothetical protein
MEVAVEAAGDAAFGPCVLDLLHNGRATRADLDIFKVYHRRIIDILLYYILKQKSALPFWPKDYKISDRFSYRPTCDVVLSSSACRTRNLLVRI